MQCSASLRDVLLHQTRRIFCDGAFLPECLLQRDVLPFPFNIKCLTAQDPFLANIEHSLESYEQTVFWSFNNVPKTPAQNG